MTPSVAVTFLYPLDPQYSLPIPLQKINTDESVRGIRAIRMDMARNRPSGLPPFMRQKATLSSPGKDVLSFGKLAAVGSYMIVTNLTHARRS